MRPSILTATVLSCAACTTTSTERGQGHDPAESQPARVPDAQLELDLGPPPEPAAWTDAFLSRSLLLADEIRVEGPVGLLDHIAVRSDDGLYDRHVETTPGGFVQTTAAKDGAGELVRGQLDQWQLVAYRRIVVVEKPGDVDVLVTARGDVLWQDPVGVEKRDQRLEFEGPIER